MAKLKSTQITGSLDVTGNVTAPSFVGVADAATRLNDVDNATGDNRDGYLLMTTGAGDDVQAFIENSFIYNTQDQILSVPTVAGNLTGTANNAITASILEPRFSDTSYIQIREDFDGGSSATNNTAFKGTWWVMGTTGAQVQNMATDTRGSTAPYPNHTSCNLNTTGSNSVIRLSHRTNPGWASSMFSLFNDTNTNWYSSFIFKLVHTGSVVAQVGWMSGATSAVSSSNRFMGFGFDTSRGDTEFKWESSNNAAPVTGSFGVKDTNFHKLKIWSTTAKTASIQLDNGTVFEITGAQRPQYFGMMPTFNLATKENSIKQMFVDYFEIIQWGLNR